MKTYVLYHANCTDGAGSALSAYLVFGDSAEYVPVQYGEKPPKIEVGAMVYIVDFSYPAEILLEMAARASFIQILDHHKTAKETLSCVDHPNIKVHFDMDQSGAVLTWKFFHPDRPVPLLLRHIQDRDLWEFKMHGSKQIHRALGMYEDWRDWAQFLFEVRTLIAEGDAIIQFLKIQTARIIGGPPRKFFATGDVVPVFNLPGFMISDALHTTLDKHPECPYAVGFITLPDKTIYSLRSRSNEDVDVGAIAESFGGGGHKHAAGFSVKTGVSITTEGVPLKYSVHKPDE
jgi:oligoribonuclease NrnB/cAMP/cGMP phosphodiesterase (DHH superfamily)